LYENYLEDANTKEENEEPLLSMSLEDYQGTQHHRDENHRQVRERLCGNVWAGLIHRGDTTTWQRNYGNIYTSAFNEDYYFEALPKHRPQSPNLSPWN